MGDGDNGDVPGDVGVSAGTDGTVSGDAGFGGVGDPGSSSNGIADLGLGIGLGQPIGNMGLADLGLADIGFSDIGLSFGGDVSSIGNDLGLDQSFNTDADMTMPEMVDPSMNISKGLVALANLVGIPGPVMSGIIGMNNNNTGQVGQATLGAIGAIGAGPIGGVIGSAIGSALGNIPSMSGEDVSAANTANADPSNASGANMNTNDILGGLMSLYNYNQGSKALGGAINGLGGAFGQDSPYAQQLRQQLSRKDAASGRRSQYGPREVELQARLAQMSSQNAPHILQAQLAQQKMRAQGLAQLYGFAQKSGLLNKLPGLGSIFGGGQDPGGLGMDIGQMGGQDAGFGGYGGYDTGGGWSTGIGDTSGLGGYGGMGNSDLGNYDLNLGGIFGD